MIFWLLFAAQSVFAISNDPRFLMSPTERQAYTLMAVRSVVAVESFSPPRLCSGTLVAKNKVLTSAHCFDTENGEVPEFHVKLMNDALTCKKSIRIKSVEVHPLWLIGRKALADWNSSLYALYSEISQISTASPMNCRLRTVQWDQADLPVYLTNIEKFEKNLRQPPSVCQKAVLQIGQVLKKYRHMLDKYLINEKLSRPGDLAVAVLDTPVQDGFHQPMDIDYDYQPSAEDNRIAFISGFGFTAEGQKFEDLPRVLNVGYSSFKGMETEDLMKVFGSAVVCSGDSGGPTAYVQRGRMKLVGVNAATSACDFRKGTGESISIRANASWLRDLLAKD